MPTFPSKVSIVEVGPRDGLQNEAVPVPTAAKVAFITALAEAGLSQIEAGSFVHPKLVPQLADADAVFAQLMPMGEAVYSALVPNERGLDRAIAAGVRRIAVFTAASETFAKKNVGMTIDESLTVFRTVVKRAVGEGMTVRAYLSTAFVCPFEGKMDRSRVADLTAQLFELGADEVAISDTIGAAVPSDIYDTVGHILSVIMGAKIALHLHDTRGTALANVLAGLELGVTTFDSSAGGLGGCPFAPGASGNLATEDLLYMLHGMGIETGVNMDAVIKAADAIAGILGRPLTSAGWRRNYDATKDECRPH
jgi:hydroxymethylglutaryl-CoA lyase